MTGRYRGTCFREAIEVEADGPPIEMGFCHCGSCRAWSGAPLVGYALWPSGDVRVIRGADLLGAFDKTGMSERCFCTRCGGHLMSRHPGLGFTDIHPPILAGLVFAPSRHVSYAAAVLPVRDGLPKLADFPVEAGGTGRLLPE